MSKTSRHRDVQRQSLFSGRDSTPRLIPEAWADTTKETVNKREKSLSPYAAGERGPLFEAASFPLPHDWEIPAQQTAPEDVREAIRRNLQHVAGRKWTRSRPSSFAR